MKRFGIFLAAVALVALAIPAQAADPALSIAANAAFLAANKTKPGWHETPSGLQFKRLHDGPGKRPGPNDEVTVFYTGTLINGRWFDGTEPDGLPANFQTNRLIRGWTEALMLMREGDHWQLVIPANLGYGTQSAGDGAIPPNQTLLFDLTLVTVTTPKEKPKDPSDDEKSPGNGAE